MLVKEYMSSFASRWVMAVARAEFVRSWKTVMDGGRVKHHLSLVRVNDEHLAATCRCGAMFRLVEVV